MTLCFRNRQRVCPIDMRLLRRILRYVIDRHFNPETCELCFHFVEAKEMAQINERFLDHVGPTDVITFSHGDARSGLSGEVFICPEVAVSQAKEFGTSWQEEIVRYAIHGLLHLDGQDDRAAAPRRKMKREEERLLGELGRQFTLARLKKSRK